MGGNKYYVRGASAEREARDMLRAQGWEAYRAAGSHGRADLVAVDLKSEFKLEYSTYAARLIQIKVCEEKSIKRYLREKVPGVELWLKILGKGWLFLYTDKEVTQVRERTKKTPGAVPGPKQVYSQALP